MINMFIFLYVEKEKVWLQENMYAFKHCLIALPKNIVKKVQPNLKVSQDRQKRYIDLK